MRPIGRISVYLMLFILIVTAACNSDKGPAQSAEPSSLRVERADCYRILAMYPEVTASAERSSSPLPRLATDSPYCSSTVAVGQEIPLVVFSRQHGVVEGIVTESVRWVISDPSQGSISSEGVFKPYRPGTVEIRACLNEECSEPYGIAIVEDPRIVALVISPSYPYRVMMRSSENAIGITVPDCIDCTVPLRLLVGSTAQFYAHGILETGEWIELTREVTWLSSEPDVADVDSSGLVTARSEGITEIRATYRELISNEVPVEVLAQAILMDVWITKESPHQVLRVGGIDHVTAYAWYDPPMESDITKEVRWIISDPGKVAIDSEGVITGLAPGEVSIMAEYQGVTSNELSIEIWDEVEMEYCEPANPNRASWEDEYNRVFLETDCAYYDPGHDVTIRYVIEEKQPHPWGVLDPCLDLVVLDRTGEIIKKLRFEGCGDLPLFAIEKGQLASPEVIYAYSAVWDQTDDRGRPVSAGTYIIAGRFYIYYDPVIHLSVSLTE